MLSDKLKTVGLMAARAFGPIVMPIGALLTMLSEWSDVLLGPDTLAPFVQTNLLRIGLSLFLVGATAILLRMEWRFRETDAYFGNEHRRGLLFDGIPPVRDEYLRYVFDGDYAVVSRFWKAGLVNVKDSRNRADLHVACESGHAAIAQGILERGAHANGQDGTDLTPLMAAAIGGKVQVMDILLKHGASLHAKSLDGGTSPLFIAAAYGHTEAVRYLLKHGASTNAPDHNNLTPLMATIAQKKWDAAAVLLDHAADASRIDGAGASLLDYAKAFSAPDALSQRLANCGARPVNASLRYTGGGFSRYGHVRVNWAET